MEIKTIRPGINIPGHGVIYPNGDMWLSIYARAGCDWAWDAIEKRGEDFAIDFKMANEVDNDDTR